jgi:hypothetical protein
MSDLLVRLYALPDIDTFEARAANAGITVRRCEAWDRFPMRRFIEEHFTETWASEADFAFSGGHPITAFVAIKDGAIAGFAVFECTRRGYFGPTGVRADLRGGGAGAVLLLRSMLAMREMGYAYAIIGGAGAAPFYEQVVGATLIEGSYPGIYSDLYREREQRGEESH